ncbi:hypothetical protein PV328_007499, partial [Microctonus aethiopoides]
LGKGLWAACQKTDDCFRLFTCKNGMCVNPCTYVICGPNARCSYESRDGNQCRCIPPYRGNPTTGCFEIAYQPYHHRQGGNRQYPSVVQL